MHTHEEVTSYSQPHSSPPNVWRGLPEGEISQDGLQFYKMSSAQAPDTLEMAPEGYAMSPGDPLNKDISLA